MAAAAAAATAAALAAHLLKQETNNQTPFSRHSRNGKTPIESNFDCCCCCCWWLLMAAATAAALARMSYSLARSPLRLPGSADIYHMYTAYTCASSFAYKVSPHS